MGDQIQESWKQLQEAVSTTQNVTALTMAVYLVLGGLLALYLRVLYTRCSATISDSDSVTRIFPLLTMVTTAVIAVVNSSLALSLGMVGALSIVRFRAAIKEPEELVYVFLCITIGITLGNQRPLLAVTLVVVATLFILGMHYLGRTRRSENLLLTVTGDAAEYFSDESTGAIAAIRKLAGDFSVQRMDIESGRGQIRVALRNRKNDETLALVTQLRQQLPECEISYVNLSTML
jgi:hypothetical protein